jgi:6-phosphogluconolactonase
MDRLTARIHVFADPARVALEAARAIAGTLAAVSEERGRCRWALAGGSTPRATYEQLASPAISERIAWARIDAFFGDERMVPPEDVSSNYRMVREALLDRVPIPPKNIHRILGELGAAEAARRYAAELGDEPLDLVFLGMGDDGHVASLFPGSQALDGPGAVLSSEAPVAPRSRVTLSLSVINSASRVFLIVTGPGKAERLREVFAERRSGRPVLPAARVHSTDDGTEWFLDATAASLLDQAP